MSDKEEAIRATEEEELDFSSMKKKKKSTKKKVVFDDPTDQTENTEAGPDNDEQQEEDPEQFTNLKKKKKKKKESMTDFEAEVGDEKEDANESSEAQTGASEDWLKSDRDYQYNELLGRFYTALRKNNPELAEEKTRFKIVPPIIQREGNKKTIFANLKVISDRLHRRPEHIILFLFAELGTSGSVDGAGNLVIKGRFQQKQIENVLRHYIVDYVTCRTCKSPDTILHKDNRIDFVQCGQCGSSRSVSAIKTGFKAQTKEDRRAQKNT